MSMISAAITARHYPFGSSEGGGSFSPSDLGLALDLRVPTTTFTTGREALADGNLLFKNVAALGGTDDVMGIMDHSTDLAPINIIDYENPLQANFTLAGVTATDDVTINGSDGWMKVEPTLVDEGHLIKITTAAFSGKVLRIRFKIFTAGQVDGVGLYHPSSNPRQDFNELGTGYFEMETFAYWRASTTLQINIHDGIPSGGDPAFLGQSGDAFYIKDIIIDEVTGNHFIEANTSQMPHWNNIRNSVDFDGIDDGLTIQNQGLMAQLNDDELGEFYWNLWDDELDNAGLTASYIWVNTTDKINGITFDTGNKISTIYNGLGATIYSSGAEERGKRLKINYGSDATNGFAYIEREARTVQSGPDGNWFADLGGAVTTYRISENITTSAYSAFGLCSHGYKTAANLNAGERTSLWDWMDADVLAFQISDITLDWDLRTPTEPLTDITSRNNGLVTMRLAGNMGENPDISGIIDQSQDKALTPVYTSDFSVNADGFAGIGNNSAVGNIDGIGGEDNWMKMETTPGVLYHIGRRTGSYTAQEIHHVTLKVLIPSTNTRVTGLWVGTGQSGARHFDIIPDEINILSFYITPDVDYIDLLHLDGTTGASFDVTGDLVYVKDIVVSSVAGSHFIAPTISAMPHWDNTALIVDFDGIDDELNDQAGNFFTAYGSDTRGAFFQHFKDGEPSGIQCHAINIVDNGIGTTRIELGIDPSNGYTLTTYETGPAYNRIASTASWPRSETQRRYDFTNGTAWWLRRNGGKLKMSPFLGGNNGEWMGDIAVTEINIGIRNFAAPIWDAFGFLGAGYVSDENEIENNIVKLDAWLKNRE